MCIISFTIWKACWWSAQTSRETIKFELFLEFSGSDSWWPGHSIITASARMGHLRKVNVAVVRLNINTTKLILTF
jgi:hypothetical protein